MRKKSNYISLTRLIPNIVTLFALCSGLLALYHSFMMHWEKACFFIIIAAVFDVFDGKFAKLLNAQSDFGANLDSLCDFVNYTIFAPIIMFNWSMWNHQKYGWYAVMVAAICGAIRLARFNTEDKINNHPIKKQFFRGIPSPAAGILILLPLTIHNGFAEYIPFSIQYPPFFMYEIYISIIALSMVGTFPTFALKYIKIPKNNIAFTLVLVAFILLSFFVFTWQAVVFYCLLYLMLIPLTIVRYLKMMKEFNLIHKKNDIR